MLGFDQSQPGFSWLLGQLSREVARWFRRGLFTSNGAGIATEDVTYSEDDLSKFLENESDTTSIHNL
ncbi:MAG: hypothetical protein ACREHD_18760 [Pirellulales bacterium]